MFTCQPQMLKDFWGPYQSSSTSQRPTWWRTYVPYSEQRLDNLDIRMWTALPAGVMHQLCALLEKAPKHTSMHCLRVLGRMLDS